MPKKSATKRPARAARTFVDAHLSAPPLEPGTKQEMVNGLETELRGSGLVDVDPDIENAEAMHFLLEPRERAAAPVPSLEDRRPIQMLDLLEQQITRAKEEITEGQDGATAYRDRLLKIGNLVLDGIIALERYRRAHPEAA